MKYIRLFKPFNFLLLLFFSFNFLLSKNFTIGNSSCKDKKIPLIFYYRTARVLSCCNQIVRFKLWIDSDNEKRPWISSYLLYQTKFQNAIIKGKILKFSFGRGEFSLRVEKNSLDLICTKLRNNRHSFLLTWN